MIKFSVLTILILFSNCQSKIEHKNDIKEYLERDLKISFNYGELYMFFPLYNGKCATVQKLTREFLLTLKETQKKIHLIYIGSSNKELHFISEGLDNNYDVIYDSKNIAIRKGVIKFKSIVLIPNINGDVKYELSTKEGFKRMKEDVTNFDENY